MSRDQCIMRMEQLARKFVCAWIKKFYVGRLNYHCVQQRNICLIILQIPTARVDQKSFPILQQPTKHDSSQAIRISSKSITVEGQPKASVPTMAVNLTSSNVEYRGVVCRFLTKEHTIISGIYTMVVDCIMDYILQPHVPQPKIGR